MTWEIVGILLLIILLPIAFGIAASIIFEVGAWGLIRIVAYLLKWPAIISGLVLFQLALMATQ